jgi:hypothetical protein
VPDVVIPIDIEQKQAAKVMRDLPRWDSSGTIDELRSSGR